MYLGMLINSVLSLPRPALRAILELGLPEALSRGKRLSCCVPGIVPAGKTACPVKRSAGITKILMPPGFLSQPDLCLCEVPGVPASSLG